MSTDALSHCSTTKDLQRGLVTACPQRRLPESSEPGMHECKSVHCHGCSDPGGDQRPADEPSQAVQGILVDRGAH